MNLYTRIAVLTLALAAPVSAIGYDYHSDNTSDNQVLQTRLDKLEELLQQAGQYQRYVLLDTTARTAMQLGRYDKAGVYAQQLLQIAPRYPTDWNYASALHHSRIILGLVDIQRDDLASASRYLIAAGSVPPSDILNQNKPDFELAQALLEKGEKTAVVEYLNPCKDIWPDGLSQLDMWLRLLYVKDTIRLVPYSDK